MKWAVICAGALVTALCFAAPAPAACVPGTTWTYDDIRYVSVVQSAFPNGGWPDYSFEATYFPARATYAERASARLTAKRNVPRTGVFVASDPIASFRKIVGVLKAASFFDMRLAPATSSYIDGPEDTVTVALCGIRWSLGTIVQPGQVAQNDDSGRRFFALESELRKMIFADAWSTSTTEP
ncbi:MAG TPA: hypothetical protein VGF98_12690 [Candidatus Tumulicola sp.]|jgi:hypothetical protein